MNAYRGFSEKLPDLFKSISKEIKKGKVRSHITLEYEDGTFRLTQELDGKEPVVQTWDVP